MVDIPLQMMEFFSKLKSQLQIVKTQQSFTECIKKFSSICRAKTVEKQEIPRVNRKVWESSKEDSMRTGKIKKNGKWGWKKNSSEEKREGFFLGRDPNSGEMLINDVRLRLE